jgi:hypothetical protein
VLGLGEDTIVESVDYDNERDAVIASVRPRVGGHEIVPGGGHVAARWWPTVLPGGGRLFCPR